MSQLPQQQTKTAIAEPLERHRRCVSTSYFDDHKDAGGEHDMHQSTDAKPILLSHYGSSSSSNKRGSQPKEICIQPLRRSRGGKKGELTEWKTATDCCRCVIHQPNITVTRHEDALCRWPYHIRPSSHTHVSMQQGRADLPPCPVHLSIVDALSSPPAEGNCTWQRSAAVLPSIAPACRARMPPYIPIRTVVTRTSSSHFCMGLVVICGIMW